MNGTAAPMPWGAGAALVGTPFRVVVPGDATGGHAVCITVDMPPGVHVDAHTHGDEDQINIVVSGRVGTRVGGVESILEAGAVQLMPRDVEHELWNAGTSVAQVIEIYTPPGMEHRFAAAGRSALSSGAEQAVRGDYDATSAQS